MLVFAFDWNAAQEAAVAVALFYFLFTVCFSAMPRKFRGQLFGQPAALHCMLPVAEKIPAAAAKCFSATDKYPGDTDKCFSAAEKCLSGPHGTFSRWLVPPGAPEKHCGAPDKHPDDPEKHSGDSEKSH